MRALGLWIGIDLDPAAGGARRYCEELMARGMLCKDTHGHTIRVAPPLVIERADLLQAAGTLAEVLS